jgi:hypothetical protein
MTAKNAAEFAAFADEVAERVLNDPWTQENNFDGGEAAADFIRNAKARNARPQAEKDASRAANVERVRTAMQAAR